MRHVLLQRALLLAALVASGVVAALAACADPYATEPDPEGGADAGTGDADSGAEAQGPPDPCAHAVPPGPPALDDAPGVELPAFFLGVRTVVLANDTSAFVGFDLDGVCTCETRANTARAGAPSCGSPAPHCDLDGGVDNGVAVLAAQLSPFFALDSVPQKLISAGRRTLLVQIGKYNGRLNDKEVAIGLALSDGVREQGCPGSVHDTAKNVWAPAWCGDEKWTLRPEAVIPGTAQPLIQGVGYVRDGMLSFSLPGALLLPFNETSVLPLGSAVLQGKLVPLGEDMTPRDPARAATEKEKRLWAVEGGAIGGRLKSGDLLVGLGTIERPGTGDAGSTYLCQEPSFELVRQGVCDAIDITSARALDFDPGAACDALSVGVGFTAYPVLPGDVRMAQSPDPNPCSPGGGSGTTAYTCGKP